MPVYQKLTNKIELITINNPGTPNILEWYNVTDAGRNEIEFLKKKFDFNFQHLKASAAKTFSQRPMVMDEAGYVFMILHFPIFYKNTIVAAEIEFFIGHGYLITIHNGNLPELNEFFNLSKKNPEALHSYRLDSSAILLSEILDRLVQACYPILDRNSKSIDDVEEIIFNDEHKKSVALILNLRHNIINIRKIMQNHKNILKRLRSVESSIVPKPEVNEHYSHLIEHSKRIWEMLENQKEMIEVLNATNESLINHKLNAIMKTLTIFSVIVFPLTLLAAIFGMNAKYMPFVEHPFGFWIIIAIMVTCSFFMLLYFSRKNWLK